MRGPLGRRRPYDPQVVEALRRTFAEQTEGVGDEQFADRVLAALDRPETGGYVDSSTGDREFEPDPDPSGDPHGGPRGGPHSGARRRGSIRRGASRPVPSRPGDRRAGRRWAVLAPVLSVLLVVCVGLAVGFAQLGHHDDDHRAATPPPVSSPPTSVPTARSSVSAQPTQQVTQSQETNRVQPLGVLHDVRILDLTFTGQHDGWALASADCLMSGGTCTALLRTTNGRTWTSRAGPPVNVPGVTGGCATACAEHIRFATAQIGYVYGPDVLFMTVDGGAHWTRQSGGAVALETAVGNVVRVTSTGAGCPGPCGLAVQTAPIGSTKWTPRDIGPAPTGTVAGVQLARSGTRLYLLVTANPAGGAEQATSTLLRSSDSGASWAASGEVCPQTGGEQDSTVVASGGDRDVAVLCRQRTSGRLLLATSADSGATFAERGALVDLAATTLADSGSGVYLAGGAGLQRLAGGSGARWTAIGRVSGPVTFVGFESGSVARVVGDAGSTIWTTSDAGRTWSSVRFQ